jgi:hypothetical protein
MLPMLIPILQIDLSKLFESMINGFPDNVNKEPLETSQHPHKTFPEARPGHTGAAILGKSDDLIDVVSILTRSGNGQGDKRPRGRCF